MFEMPEALLHFVWQSLRFSANALQTRQGEAIRIVHPGRLNPHQGPDFLDARLQLGGLAWSGHVEHHLKSEDWYRHGHHLDPHYNGVVLHVVMEAGKRPICREDGTVIPELVLAPHISTHLLARYDQLRLSEDKIPCARLFGDIPMARKRLWAERLAIERVAQKAEQFRQRLEALKEDWTQLLWEEVAAMMGGPVNQEAFRAIARRLPIALVLRYRERSCACEGLLFGMGGLLTSRQPEGDAYYQKLRQEWHFLRHKHQLADEGLPPLRFARMRPPSFPTLRLAQLGALLKAWPQLLHLLQPENFPFFLGGEIAPHPYWNTHFRFGKTHKARSKNLGQSQKHILLINTLIPLAYLYQKRQGQPQAGELIESVLAALPAENNRHLRAFHSLGLQPENSLQSQGLIQLKKHYCNEKRCLACQLGSFLLGSHGRRSDPDARVSESSVLYTVASPGAACERVDLPTPWKMPAAS
jgi:hypothetical protein